MQQLEIVIITVYCLLNLAGAALCLWGQKLAPPGPGRALAGVLYLLMAANAIGFALFGVFGIRCS